MVLEGLKSNQDNHSVTILFKSVIKSQWCTHMLLLLVSHQPNDYYYISETFKMFSISKVEADPKTYLTVGTLTEIPRGESGEALNYK